MTIGRAIDHLIAEYFDAIQKDYVRKPVAYALYHTWKWVDAKEKTRKKEVQDDDRKRLYR